MANKPPWMVEGDGRDNPASHLRVHKLFRTMKVPPSMISFRCKPRKILGPFKTWIAMEATSRVYRYTENLYIASGPSRQATNKEAHVGPNICVYNINQYGYIYIYRYINICT